MQVLFRLQKTGELITETPTSTPRERGTQPEQQEAPQQWVAPPPMNRTYPLNKVPQYNFQEPRHQPYDGDTLVRHT